MVRSSRRGDSGCTCRITAGPTETCPVNGRPCAAINRMQTATAVEKSPVARPAVTRFSLRAEPVAETIRRPLRRGRTLTGELCLIAALAYDEQEHRHRIIPCRLAQLTAIHGQSEKLIAPLSAVRPPFSDGLPANSATDPEFYQLIPKLAPRVAAALEKM